MLRRQLRTLFGSGGSRFGSGSSATLTNAGNPFKFSASKTEMKTSHDPSQGGYKRKDHPRDSRRDSRRDNQRRRAPRDHHQENTRPQHQQQHQLQPPQQYQQQMVGQYPQDYQQPQHNFDQYSNQPPPPQQQQQYYPQGNMQGQRQPRGNRRNRAPRRKPRNQRKKLDWMPTNAKCGEKTLTFSFPKRPSVAFTARVLGPVVDGEQTFHSANFYPEDLDRLRNIKEKGITTSSPLPDDPDRDTKYSREVRIMPNGKGGGDVTFTHKPPLKPKEGQKVGEAIDLKFTLSRPEWISFYHKIALRYTEGSKHHVAGVKWRSSHDEKRS